MKIVNYNELKELKFLGSGRYSYTSIVEFNDDFYCFKRFKTIYDDDVINRLSDMTEKSFDKHFITPLYMVLDKNSKMIGYLSAYYGNLFEMKDTLTYEEQINIIKSAKDNIEILHNEYNRIHGDLHYDNILCDKKKLKAYLLDFDLSMNIGQEPKTFNNYTLAVQNYLKYYPFDVNVDKYHFNLCTIHYLAKYYQPFEDLIKSLVESMDIPEINEDVKRLTKELLLSDTRKPYSGEYIIDYIG